jgi:ABC-type polysaccharide/polyol phosphate transport system ATPase subunit
MFKVAGRLLKSASVGVRRGICDLTPRGSGFSKAKTMVESAVRCRGLVKRYGNVTAVDGLDLDVRSGECFGMLGPNGAGKTTTVEIFGGLREADAGDVEVWGITGAVMVCAATDAPGDPASGDQVPPTS